MPLPDSGSPGSGAAPLSFVRSGLVTQLAERLRKTSPKDGLQLEGEMLTRANDLREVARRVAREIYRSRESWVPRLSDDAIWMDATAAESLVLFREWDTAADRYANALRPENRPQPFHFDSIIAQLKRLQAGYERLGERLEGRLADPNFFPDLAIKADAAWPTASARQVVDRA